MIKKLLAEFLATFILVLFSAGGAYVSIQQGIVGPALVSGVTVCGLIIAFGEISGAHLNPAVTLAFAINGSFKWKSVPSYIIVQLLASSAAALFLTLIYSPAKNIGYTIPTIDLQKAFAFEILLAFVLMLVILQVSHRGKEIGLFAAIAIGAIVTAEIILAGSITGGSMNPARSFGPGIIGDVQKSLWVFLSAPFIGMALSVPIHKLICKK